MSNIHGTLVSLNNKGLLLIGKSGSGKSDLALQLIMGHQAKLVSDDRVELSLAKGKLYGSAPHEIIGKMEIRQLGIASVKAKKRVSIDLCVELVQDRKALERLPDLEYIDFLGVSITKIKLYPFDCSTIYKILAKINGLISQ